MSDRIYTPKKSTSSYSQEFEKYWGRTDHYVGSHSSWQDDRVKRLAFNAWKAARRGLRRHLK